MSEGIVFVNRGTLDCKASLKWAKKQAPDARIVSLSLENDPYVDQAKAARIAAEEGVEHHVMPFEASYIASKNQNVEKAWEFERLFKGLQYQRMLSCSRTVDELNFTFVLVSLRGDEFGYKLVDIFKRYIQMNLFTARYGLDTYSYISYPLENVKTDEDFARFLAANKIEVSE